MTCIMRLASWNTLYTNPDYRAHLKRRNETQTIMVGFSDGTKDGGYLMANWSIYKAKGGTYAHFKGTWYQGGFF